jgi:ATP:corrinoid adenosyltransferase
VNRISRKSSDTFISSQKFSITVKKRGKRRGGRKKTQRKRLPSRSHSRLKIAVIAFFAAGVTGLFIRDHIWNIVVNADRVLNRAGFQIQTAFSALDYWSQLSVVALVGWMAAAMHKGSTFTGDSKNKKNKAVRKKTALLGSGWEHFVAQHMKGITPATMTKKMPAKREEKKVSKKKANGILSKIKAKFHMKSSDKKKLFRKKKAKVFQITISPYETGIDALYRAVQKYKQLSLDDVVLTFKIKKDLAEEWTNTLKAKGLISISYPTFGSMMLTTPQYGKEKKGDKSTGNKTGKE